MKRTRNICDYVSSSYVKISVKVLKKGYSVYINLHKVVETKDINKSFIRVKTRRRAYIFNSQEYRTKVNDLIYTK